MIRHLGPKLILNPFFFLEPPRVSRKSACTSHDSCDVSWLGLCEATANHGGHGSGARLQEATTTWDRTRRPALWRRRDHRYRPLRRAIYRRFMARTELI